MPKAAKSGRARLHDKAAKLAKVQKGGGQDASTPDVVNQVNEGMAIASNSDVKGKKRAIESKVPSTTSGPFSGSASVSSSTNHPYNLSKSSRKRLNKKTRENLSLGSMAGVQDALGSILNDEAGPGEDDMNDGIDDEDSDDEEEDGMSVDGTVLGKKKRRKGKKNKKSPAQGGDGGKPKIGEGRGRTLKEKQRKEQILSSRAHVQAVLQNPAFKANPFAAIREHAGNSLVMIDKQVKA